MEYYSIKTVPFIYKYKKFLYMVILLSVDINGFFNVFIITKVKK